MHENGVSRELADFLWAKLQPYYFKALTPHPSDRIDSHLRIDPDDISEIAVDYEKKFEVRFNKNPIDCPSDPTIAEFALALQRASVPAEHA